MLVQVVLLSKLQIPQKLGVASFHAHVSPSRWFLDTSPVGFSGLVMSCVILGLSHFALLQRKVSCRSESSNPEKPTGLVSRNQSCGLFWIGYELCDSWT